MGKYAKFIVAALGAVATSVVQVFGPDTTAGRVATIVLAAVTALAVYVVPNTPGLPQR
jgi:hypothetical protein